MKETALESVRLLPADSVSELMIHQLRLDGIYTIRNSSYITVNIVLVSTERGVDNVLNVLQEHQPARKNVIVKITPELSVPNGPGIDSILEFQPDSKPYSELKEFLKLYKGNVEIHGMICFDFNDFFTLIRGRNVISTVSYEYREDITEALSQLKPSKIQNGDRYLLYFTVNKFDNKEMPYRLVPINDFMETFPDKNIMYWNFRESSPQIVTLFTSTPIE